MLAANREPDDLLAEELVAAAYQEAGQAVAEFLFGRALIRVACSAEEDPGTLRSVLTAKSASRQLRELADRLFPWLLKVNRLERSGALTADEAAAARSDLWQPFFLWTGPEDSAEAGEKPEPAGEEPAAIDLEREARSAARPANAPWWRDA